MRQVVLYDGDAATVTATDSESEAVVVRSPQTAEAHQQGQSAAASQVPATAVAKGADGRAVAVHEGWVVEAIVPSGVGGATDYGELTGKPSIEGVTLIGDKSFADLGMAGSESIDFDHGIIAAIELTAAQTAALLT